MTSVESNIADRIASSTPFDGALGDSDSGYTKKDRAWGDFWVGCVMMRTIERWPALVRCTKPLFVSTTWRAISNLRTNLMLNAGRILPQHAGYYERTALGKAVLGNFYDFVCEIGNATRHSERDLQSSIGEVIGREGYLRARALKQGAILVTAHLGAFETGVAALRQHESRVHIVFRRDRMKRFERLRATQRQRLGVIEAPVDDGLSAWIGLRDALLNNEVVLMQGDRVMPGQSGLRVPFCGGHILIPRGPVKLALMTGAPLIPIFAPRMPDRRVRIILDEPINIVSDRVDEAVITLAGVIERMVRAYPEQWLVLHRAFCEDQATTLLDRCDPHASARRRT